MSISQRVKALAELEDSKAKFAKKIGITPAGLSDMIKKDTGLRSSTIVAILKLYDNPKLNPSWLLLGEGEMWLEEPTEITDSDQSQEDPLFRLMKQRIQTLEREIRKNNPELADELGIG